ncbi:MAG TPA: sugar phosphate isomerase/epimerase [bacterium]|nr:sugar phosphate isomerase/epimerase [bacterium]
MDDYREDVGISEEEEFEDHPIKIGIDEWCYHNSMMVGRMSLDDVIRKAGDLGLDGISFDYFMMERQDRKDPSRLVELIREFGLELVFGFGIPFALPEIVFQLMERKKNEMFDLAHEFGATTLRVCGGVVIPNMVHKPFHLVVNRKKEVEEVARRLKIFTNDASLEGLTVALENHTDYKVEEMLQIIHTVESEDFKVTLDTGNPIYHEEDPVETAIRLAPYTGYTHIKDMKFTGPMLYSTALGKGDVNIPQIVEELRNRLYDGIFSVECALPLWEVDIEDQSVDESVEYLRNLSG